MPVSISEIQQKISSNDIDVLRQSLEIVRRCLLQENERGKAAETRATVMLGILGVIGTLVIAGAEKLPTSSKPGDAEWLLLACFVSCLLFLIKALFYAMRTIGIAKKYRLEPHMIFDFKDASQAQALQSEIAGIIWEYDRSIESNSGRLFLLQRCQRSSYVSILILVLFGFFSIEILADWIVVSLHVPIGLSALFGALFVILDPLAEKVQGIWSR